MARSWGIWLATLALFTQSGCFFYDSTWGEAKASQKRVAQHRMPSQLAGRDAHAPATLAKVEHFRIRAYATPRYASALVDAEAQFAQTLADANPTLAHDVSMQLELESYRVWKDSPAEDDLKTLLKAIEQRDAGMDVDWVVVLAGPLRMVALSPDQLGMANVLGRHLVIRAMSDPDEMEVIERSFTELSEGERHKLYAARKRHKSATVLLHEVGHTLGMPHEVDTHSMMSARYDEKASAFSPLAARIGRRALELRASELGSELHQNSARAALNLLSNAPPGAFESASAADSRTTFGFHAQTRRPAKANPASTSHAAPTPPAKSDLSAADAELFEQARVAHAAGRHREARAMASPLFERYPNVYAVQEIRCQLATKVGLPMSAESEECAPLLKLSGSPF